MKKDLCEGVQELDIGQQQYGVFIVNSYGLLQDGLKVEAAEGFEVELREVLQLCAEEIQELNSVDSRLELWRFSLLSVALDQGLQEALLL